MDIFKDSARATRREDILDESGRYFEELKRK